jgi:hypothetical protein
MINGLMDFLNYTRFHGMMSPKNTITRINSGTTMQTGLVSDGQPAGQIS